MLEHLAASLGLDAPTSEPLEAQLAEMGGRSHVVLHQQRSRRVVPPGEVVRSLAKRPEVRRVDVLPRPGVTLAEGATIARATLSVRATDDGTALTPAVEAIVAAALDGEPEPSPPATPSARAATAR